MNPDPERLHSASKTVPQRRSHNNQDLRPEMLAVIGVVLVLVAGLCMVVFWGITTLMDDRAELDALPAPSETLAPKSTMDLPRVTGQAPAAPTPTAAVPPATVTATTVIEMADPAPSPAPTLLPPMATHSVMDIELLLSQMTLEEKIGQMIMTGIPGDRMGVVAQRLVSEYQIGSVVYFGENTPTAQGTRELSQALQAAAASSGHGIPLMIAIDHEGGKVYRFREGLTHFPNLMTLGAAGSPELAQMAGAAAAQELLAVGINTSLGPVLDVNSEPFNPVIGVRSLSDDPQRVMQIGMAYIAGIQSAGVIAAPKHFPGHGATAVDSHETLPVLGSRTLDDLQRDDLPPFQAAVPEAGMIMVGHIAFPQIDPSGKPASLSPVFIQQILRQNMDYDGVVVTDAMSMGAIVKSYPADQAAKLAVLAGVDLLAYTDAQTAVRAYETLLQGVNQGEIPLSRVEESARRVLQLKARFGLFEQKPVDEMIPIAENGSLAADIARQAVTMIGDPRLPLVDTPNLLLVTPDTLPAGLVAGDATSYLGELLMAQGLGVDEWIYSPENEAQIAVIQGQVLQALPNYPLAIVVTWDARLKEHQGRPVQVNLVKAVMANNGRVVLVAGSSPYDLALAAPGVTGIAIYGGLGVQVEALLEALFSSTPPTGTLPIVLH